jgi:putative intracellular protease/amidase
MPVPRTALIAITSAHAPLYPDGGETGLFLTEALHPFEGLRKAGFEVDLVSETGQYSVDALSLNKPWVNDEELAVYNDHSSEFRSKLDKLNKPSDIDPSKYGVFFASAGHASLIDYPEATGLQQIAAKIYANGGIVSAVCHGGAIFPGIKGPDGKSIINGREVTGFTTKGEEEEGVLDTIKSWNRPTIENSAAEAGAKYVAPPGPWASFTHTDGRIITGANPLSSVAVTEAIVKAFDAL